MKYVKLGNTSLEVSKLCLGCMGVESLAEEENNGR